MEVKKSPKADLEGKKTIFLEIGFVIALGILLSAFNWKTNTKVEEGFVITQEEQVEEEITVSYTHLTLPTKLVV